MNSDIYWQNRTEDSQHVQLFFCVIEPRNVVIQPRVLLMGKLKHSQNATILYRDSKKQIF